jgi:hypothetical protein
MKKQFWRIGDQLTNRPWDRPTLEAVLVWWEKFKETKYLDQFEVWIGGGFLEGTETWDVDIILTGAFKFPADLKHVLDEGILLGLKHWILIDIIWQDKLYSEEFIPYKSIRNFNEIEKQTSTEHILKEYKGEEIYPGLYQKKYTEPNEAFKWRQKMKKEGRYTLGLQKMSEYIYNNKQID